MRLSLNFLRKCFTGATSILALGSCSLENEALADKFNYVRSDDKFASITTSVAESDFFIDRKLKTYVNVEIKCIHNIGDSKQDSLMLSVISSTNNDYENSEYFDALVYKFDNQPPVVYQEPNPWDGFINESPDDEYGHYRKIFGEAEAAKYTPLHGMKNIDIDVFNLFGGRKQAPKTLALRVVYGAPSSIFGSQSVQYYSQYRSVDIQIDIPGTNFGKVLTDCGITGLR